MVLMAGAGQHLPDPDHLQHFPGLPWALPFWGKQRRSFYLPQPRAGPLQPGSHIPLEVILPLVPGPTESKGEVPDGLGWNQACGNIAWGCRVPWDPSVAEEGRCRGENPLGLR